MRGMTLLARRLAIRLEDRVYKGHSGPITGRRRSTCLRSGGSALANAWRTIRRCTLSLSATALIVPTPNSYSLRICSNSSTLALRSIPSLLPLRQDAGLGGVGPIYGIERGRFTVSKSGWAVAEQGSGEEGFIQMRQGLAAYQATGTEM